MYNKSKNGLLFAVFVLIILLTVSILVISVYNARKNEVEEYKISLNNTIYDKDYSYIPLQEDAILKKEWDKNYYLYVGNNSNKYDLGTEPVFFDKAKKQISIYGIVYQVYPNGDIKEKTKKIFISNLDDFQFFKLNDRKYLIIGDSIISDSFQTNNYLIVSIDKGGNALLINNDINIKTIHPIVLSVGDIKFDVANERLIYKEESIDLKKINGSTNEYIEKEETDDSEIITNTTTNNTTNNTNNQSNSEIENNKQSGGTINSQVYNNIVKQILNISSLLGTNNKVNNTTLYKNISLRTVNPGASYIDITYSIVDPENKYASVFITLKDSDDNTNYYYLSKESSQYRINGLEPNKRYELTMNYITTGSNQSSVADSVIVLTSNDPTVVKIVKVNGNAITYNVKVYNEYQIDSALVSLTNCSGFVLDQQNLDVDAALQQSGATGELQFETYSGDFMCLELLDVNNNETVIKSYHKIKIK